VVGAGYSVGVRLGDLPHHAAEHAVEERLVVPLPYRVGQPIGRQLDRVGPERELEGDRAHLFWRARERDRVAVAVEHEARVGSVHHGKRDEARDHDRVNALTHDRRDRERRAVDVGGSTELVDRVPQLLLDGAVEGARQGDTQIVQEAGVSAHLRPSPS
jgi:hypothetical protein